MQLFAVLVGDDGARGCSCVGGDLGGGRWFSRMLRGLLRPEMKGQLTTTPPSYMHPTMVVPVLVALGSGTPRA